MRDLNTIGVDLAKTVIQVLVVTPAGRELSNKALTRKKFGEFLVTQTESLVAFEACASAHHWARFAKRAGHRVRILPVLSVAPFRQGHKTDRNDALAVAEAAVRPTIKEAPLKSVEQQELQAIQRSHSRLTPRVWYCHTEGVSHLHQAVPDILEDAENGVPDMFRSILALMHERLLVIKQDIDQLTTQIEMLVKSNDACKRLLDIEGVGPISAVLLFATLGSGEAFHSAREFSAYLGLTPKQYSSGGKTNLIGISRYVANKRLRAILIQGARAYIYRVKEPKSPKDKWLMAMVDRAGYGEASVALANKNVRTAWAMLTQGTEYNKLEGLAA